MTRNFAGPERHVRAVTGYKRATLPHTLSARIDILWKSSHKNGGNVVHRTRSDKIPRYETWEVKSQPNRDRRDSADIDTLREISIYVEDMASKSNIANQSCIAPLRASTRLRKALQDPSQLPLVCPGVYDGLTARLTLSHGFNAMYMTGAGTSMSRIGMADLGIATMNEMADTAAMISQLDPSVPVIADADAGYGAPLKVARTVRAYIRSGLAGFHLEDQVVNKKCGHLAGKQLVDVREYISRIRAAVKVRKELGSDIVIIARTDALAVTNFDDAIGRLRAAVNAGADVAFLEAISTKEEAKKVCDIFNPMGVPVMYGMVQGSHSPHITVSEAKEMGISIIVYAALCLRSAVKGIETALATLKEQGDCEHDSDAPSPKYMFEKCGLKELQEFDDEIKAEVDELLGDIGP